MGGLPVGVSVIDAVATVRFAIERARQIVGFGSWAGIGGQSVTEFVAEEDLSFLIEGVVHWSGYGRTRRPDLGAAGYVVTLTPETVVTAATPHQIRHLDQAADMTALAPSRRDHENQLQQGGEGRGRTHDGRCLAQ